ncbi:MAG TPA: hypothetical protein VFW24_00880 [Acidimicrobiales bacterium]|nr:hypothetical protein [Acidimicrobiales bacterium]
MTSDHAPRPAMTCAEARTVLPELGLDILPGDVRAAALTHVEECAVCQADLAGLVAVGDALVSLAPAVEPPAGFEQRVLSALPAPAGRRTRRVWLAAAAAVALLAAGFGGWALGPASAPNGHPAPVAATGPLVEATLTAHGTTVGRVYAYWDNPGWVYMTVDQPGLTGRVTCELVRANGATTDIGWFMVDNGSGFWGAPVPFDPSTVRQARLLDAHGNVVATARL